jgi:hypothetical protein
MKFCIHCIHKLHSAASKFHFIGNMLLFKAVSNLFASITFIVNQVVVIDGLLLKLQLILFSHLSVVIEFDNFKFHAVVSDQAFNTNIGIAFDLNTVDQFREQEINHSVND